MIAEKRSMSLQLQNLHAAKKLLGPDSQAGKSIDAEVMCLQSKIANHVPIGEQIDSALRKLASAKVKHCRLAEHATRAIDMRDVALTECVSLEDHIATLRISPTAETFRSEVKAKAVHMASLLATLQATCTASDDGSVAVSSQLMNQLAESMKHLEQLSPSKAVTTTPLGCKPGPAPRNITADLPDVPSGDDDISEVSMSMSEPSPSKPSPEHKRSKDSAGGIRRRFNTKRSVPAETDPYQVPGASSSDPLGSAHATQQSANNALDAAEAQVFHEPPVGQEVQ
jgi:hypothetical protein